jgi:hypothetical protein
MRCLRSYRLVALPAPVLLFKSNSQSAGGAWGSRLLFRPTQLIGVPLCIYKPAVTERTGFFPQEMGPNLHKRRSGPSTV